MKEWFPLSKNDNSDGSFSRLGGIATIEQEPIEVKCKCPKCGESFESDKIMVNPPNMGGENHEESIVYTEEIYLCDKCGSEIEIVIDNGFGGVDIEVEGLSRKDIFYRLPSE